jgi:spore coat polysaccharide biosynthesis protein SpsF
VKSLLAFVQARLRSTRLPGKVLEPLAGKSVLEWIVDRLATVPELEGTVVVVPDTAKDEPLRRLCAGRGIPCVAGSEHDVLDRFHAALAVHPARRILRITADCPLVDAGVVSRLLALHAEAGADHAAVVTGALPPAPGLRRFPDGLDAEVLTSESLETAWAEAEDPYEREHVTPFVWRRPERFRLVRLEAEEDLGDERWTIDHPEDLAFVRAVYERLAPSGTFDYRDVLALLDREPSLRRLNAALRAG